MKQRIFAFLVAVLFLSGCYAHDISVVVGPDGSGAIDITAGINKQFEQQLLASGELQADESVPTDILNEFTSAIENMPDEWQAKVGPWDDGTFGGARLTLAFANIDMLREQLEAVLTLTQDSSYNNMLLDLTVEEDDGVVDLEASMEGYLVTVDGEPLPNGPAGVGRVSWAVTMKSLTSYQPSSYSAQDGGTNMVRWNIPINSLPDGEPFDMQAVGSVRSASSSPNTQPTPQPTTATTPPTTAPTAVPTIAPTAPQPTVPPIVASATLAPSDTVPSTTVPQPPSELLPTTTPQPTASPIELAPSELVPTELVESASATPGFAAPTPTQDIETIASAELPTAVSTGVPTALPVAQAVASTAAPQPSAFVPQAAQAEATVLAFVPLASENSSAAPAPSAGTIVEAKRGRPALPYRDVWIGVMLLASLCCFSYVGMRRFQHRPAPSDLATDDAP